MPLDKPRKMMSKDGLLTTEIVQYSEYNELIFKHNDKIIFNEEDHVPSEDCSWFRDHFMWPEMIIKAYELGYEKNKMVQVLQMVFKKHCLGDESIDQEELETELSCCLKNIMGTQEFIKWLQVLKSNMSY